MLDQRVNQIDVGIHVSMGRCKMGGDERIHVSKNLELEGRLDRIKSCKKKGGRLE